MTLISLSDLDLVMLQYQSLIMRVLILCALVAAAMASGYWPNNRNYYNRGYGYYNRGVGYYNRDRYWNRDGYWNNAGVWTR